MDKPKASQVVQAPKEEKVELSVVKPAESAPVVEAPKSVEAKPTKLKTAKKPAAKKSGKKAVAKKTAVKSKSTSKPKLKKATVKKKVSSKPAASVKKSQQTFTKMENIMTQGKTQFDKLAKEAANASQEGIDAVTKSSTVVFKGAEDFFKAYVSIAQKSAEKSQNAVQALLGCKTLTEFTETQNKLAQESFDDFVSSATKLSEISVKVATDAFEPINDQLTKSIKAATSSLAA